MSGFDEVIAGIWAGVLAVVFVVLYIAPFAVLGFLPKVWRTWKGKRI